MVEGVCSLGWGRDVVTGRGCCAGWKGSRRMVNVNQNKMV
jgi:hypothetical protein